MMQNRQIMKSYLQNYGIVRNHVRQVMHGEYEFDESTYNDDFGDEPYDDMHGLLHEAFEMPNTSNVLEENEILYVDIDLEKPNDKAIFFFYNFLEDAENELYLIGMTWNGMIGMT